MRYPQTGEQHAMGWKQFSNEISTKFKEYANKYNWHTKDKPNTIRFLNTLIQNENLATLCTPSDSDQMEDPAYKNRIALEHLYPQDIEKHQLRHNRKAIDTHMAMLIVPCVNDTPSFLDIASQLGISKYQVEKSLDTTRKLYKKIMRDEVARYVYPDEVSKEIKYLYSLL